jgi:starvation-inducible DNA-binding protein
VLEVIEALQVVVLYKEYYVMLRYMTLVKQLTTLKTNIMKNLNNIGLDVTSSQQTAEELNDLLSNYQMFYMNLRGFHWNIRGKRFFELHLKFEELYNDALIKVDEIAERILTLRFAPVSNLSDYLEASSIKESKSDLSDRDMVDTILGDHGKILKQLSAVVKKADDAGDEGTIDLIGAYIRELEKTSWMLDAWRKKTAGTYKEA